MATSRSANKNTNNIMASDTDTELLEVKRVAKEIREQHESSGSVFRDRKSAEEEIDSLAEMARERFSSLYEVDFYPKKVSPSEPRPCSVTRRNNPHPSEMFMNWKVPTRLIVDEPSYEQQKQRLLKDSTQRFYEDVNGPKKFTNPSHVVLSEVSQMRKLHPSEVGATRRVSRTSTTHHCPPQGMLKQLREKDIEGECLRSVAGRRPTPAPGYRSATPRLPPMMSGKIHQDPTKESMARLLRPRAVPAAAKWLQGAGQTEKQVIGDALQAADNEFVDKTLSRSLQPDAKNAVHKWLQTASEKDRDVAIEFFGSLAGGKLMGARSRGLNHGLHKDDKGDNTCRICDGDRLNQVLDALKKGNPVAAVTLRKDLKPGDMKRRHIRLLTPNTRAHKEELRTWHHLPVYQNTGPTSNSFALFTRPHRPVPRHFTIHPEWE